MGKTAKTVREPVQVYLDAPDRALLDGVARRTGLSRAEILRRGIRAVAGQMLTERAPGWSLAVLVGAAGEDAPSDLAERHDAYLARAIGRARPRAR
jgi:hypothetical protein